MANVIRRQYIKIPQSIEGPQTVRVGFPAGKVSSDIVDRAVWNHYGTRGGASGGGWGGPIPARPFILNSFKRNKRKYLEALRTSAGKILRGETTLEVVMNKLGILAQGDIQEEINLTLTPPNSPVTIAMKGSSHPLIDTGEMRQKVTWEVR